MPRPDLLEAVEHPLGASINLKKLLAKVNERIEFLYDRDHQIGHAYFMEVKDYPALCNAFATKIIPLLQEYFYDNWEKIQIVLGDHKEQCKNYKAEYKKDSMRFIKDISNNELNIIGFDHDNYDNDKSMYELNDIKKLDPEAFIKIYDSACIKSPTASPEQQTQ